MSQQLLRRAWDFIDTFRQVYPEHWSPEEQVLLDDLMKADLDLSGVKREWVGLTLEDKKEYLAQDLGGSRADAMDWAEQRLKERNT